MSTTTTSRTLQAGIALTKGSANPLHVFVDIKFTNLGIPFAYGLVVYQDDKFAGGYSARETGYFDANLMADDAWLRALTGVDKIYKDRHDMISNLRSHLRELERVDFKYSAMRGLDHSDAPRLTVYANRMTLIYLQAELSDDILRDIAFNSLAEFDAKLMKRLATKHQLPHFPYNPVTWGRAAALAVLGQVS